MTVTTATLEEPFPAQDPAYLRDPYAFLAALRDRGPSAVDPATGKLFLLNYAGVDAGLQIIRGDRGGRATSHDAFAANPFKVDGPAHTGPRRVIAHALTNREVQRFRGRVQQIVDDALTGKERGGELRVVEEIGRSLPYQLTNDLLGIPAVDNSDELLTWTWKTLDLIDAFPTPEKYADNIEAAGYLAAHIAEVAEWKRDHLGDDLFSMVIAAADQGEVMRPHQVVPYIHTLYLAGMHTTVNQIPLGLLAMLGHRHQWELLRAHPELLENAVEEILRFDGTAQYMVRTPDEDTLIGEVMIPAGQEVICWIASANRDERKWGPTANELDITRADAAKHVAFGKGPHTCIGSWLARMELEVVLATIIERYPASVLADQEPVWVSNVIRGPEELVVDLRPEGGEVR